MLVVHSYHCGRGGFGGGDFPETGGRKKGGGFRNCRDSAVSAREKNASIFHYCFVAVVVVVVLEADGDFFAFIQLDDRISDFEAVRNDLK